MSLRIQNAANPEKNARSLWGARIPKESHQCNMRGGRFHLLSRNAKVERARRAKTTTCKKKKTMPLEPKEKKGAKGKRPRVGGRFADDSSRREGEKLSRETRGERSPTWKDKKVGAANKKESK